MLDLLAKNWWAFAVRGAAALILGVLAIVLPGITAAALILMFGVFALVDGVFALVAAFRAGRRGERWGAMALLGAASLIAGAIALFAPLIAALSLVLLFAAWAIVTGALEIAAAIRLRKEIEGEWLLGLTGALTIVAGVLAAVFPAAGLLGLVWLIGIYAVFAGVLLLSLAFRLRRIQSGAAPPAPAARGSRA